MDKAKRILVQFWLKKAQRDLNAAQKLAQELPDIAIYHCQQGAEKALKGTIIIVVGFRWRSTQSKRTELK